VTTIFFVFVLFFVCKKIKESPLPLPKVETKNAVKVETQVSASGGKVEEYHGT
jgi:hypothetical protein